MLAVVCLLPLTLKPVNALLAHGSLRSVAACIAALNWAAVMAVFLPTLAASRLEGRPSGSYGLPWQSCLGMRFWEGTGWGICAATAFFLLLRANGAISFGAVNLDYRQLLKYGTIWGVALLGLALFEECLMRGYLQCTLTRSMGFWPAAILISCLFAAEKLLMLDYRNVPGMIGAILYGLMWCFALRRTGNLWFGVGFNFALGWAMVFLYGLGIPITGVAPAGAMLQPKIYGPAWLTGGQQGIHAGVMAAALIALVWFGLHFRFRKAREMEQSPCFKTP